MATAGSAVLILLLVLILIKRRLSAEIAMHQDTKHRLDEQMRLSKGIRGDLDKPLSFAHTEGREAQSKQCGSEKRFNALIRACDDAIIMLDGESRIVCWNPAAEKIFTFTETHTLGKRFSQLIELPPEVETVWDLLDGTHSCTVLPADDVYQTGRWRLKCLMDENDALGAIPLSISMRFRSDPEALPITVSVSGSIFSLNGERQGVMILRDIGALQRDLFTLHMLSLVVAHTHESVVVTDRNGIIEYVNPAFLNMTGFTLEEVLGKPMSIVSSKNHTQAFYKRMWHRILSGKTWEGELLNRRKNGEDFWEMTSINPVKDGRGEITHFVAVKKDITESRQHEMLLKSQLEELERFNRITIGREMTMIDLKKEVNALLEQLGEQEKYTIVE